MSAEKDCGCCEGQHAETPGRVFNRPGLSVIACRVGTHGDFKRSMLARLSAPEHAVLRGLTTRADDDFTVALLDAWATTADVLTFYSERIAHESYLRTATERGSLVDLARLIGYRPHPGLAAHTVLAFTVEDAAGAPGRVEIPAGFRVQSVPGPGELPQTFETEEAIEARAEWNAMRPRRLERQGGSTSELVVEGTNTGLRVGDAILVITGGVRRVKTVVAVATDSAGEQTRVRMEGAAIEVPSPPARVPVPPPEDIPAALLAADRIAVADLAAFAEREGSSVSDVARRLEAARRGAPPTAEGDDGVYALRVRASLFGHNAADWRSLSVEMRQSYGGDASLTPPASADWPPVSPTGLTDTTPPFTEAGPTPVFASGSSTDVTQIVLDRVYEKVVQGSWAALAAPRAEPFAGRVRYVAEGSVNGFGLSARATSLKIEDLQGPPLDIVPSNMGEHRRTLVYCQSERLTLAEVAIDAPVGGGRAVELDRFHELYPGQPLIVEGTLADSEGPAYREVAVVANAYFLPAEGRTLVELSRDLALYVREAVVLNANVVKATHGETVEEALGSGDAGQARQRFQLRQGPLTYTGADTPSGVESSLEVRVDGVQWHEQPNLYDRGPNETVFATWADDEASTHMQLGGAGSGARAATGIENVTARYRKGIGTVGLVAADQLTLIPARPRGLREVRNPLAARDAQDPEDRDAIRENASLTVLTLDRLVSLRDHEDFARAFAGISKALATWTWDGEERSIFLTVAGTDGALVELEDAEDLGARLLRAMDDFGTPYTRRRLASFRPAFFRLQADLDMNPDHVAEDVLSAAESALAGAFGFKARRLGEPVHLSDIVAVLHGVVGIVAVDVNELYRVPSDGSRPVPALEQRLIAEAPARSAREAEPEGAELLTVDPFGIDLRRRG